MGGDGRRPVLSTEEPRHTEMEFFVHVGLTKIRASTQQTHKPRKTTNSMMGSTVLRSSDPHLHRIGVDTVLCSPEEVVPYPETGNRFF